MDNSELLFSDLSHLAIAQRAQLSANLYPSRRGDLASTITRLCTVLGKEPCARFSSRALRPTPAWQKQTTARVLLGLINNSVTPAQPNDFPRTDLMVNACAIAENRFVRVYNALSAHAQGTPWPSYVGARIVVNDNNEPLLVQKSGTESSAITLSEMTVDGYRLPPGFLVAVKMDGEHEDDARGGQLSVLYKHQVVGLHMTRLSALALRPEERALWPASRKGNLHIVETPGWLSPDVTMESYKRAAQAIVAVAI